MSDTRVLVVSAGAYIGGDTAMFLLGLPPLRSAGFSVHAVTPPRGTAYAALAAVPGIRLTHMELGCAEMHPARRYGKQVRALQALLAVPRIAALVARERIDIIYTLDRTSGMPIAYAASRITGVPLVLNAQISHYLSTSSLHRAVLRHAHTVTVSSEHMRQKFVPYVRDPSKLVKIPNAIVLDRYNPAISGRPIRQEYGISDDAPVVVLAGRLSPFKGHEDLIRAAELIHKERSDVHFLMAGSENHPGYKAHLEGMIAEKGLTERVRLIGHRANVAEVFAAATVATMPSHEEPFGLVALEAMAMERPVVATRAGGVPEYFLDGEIGRLIAPRDSVALAGALRELLDNPERARAMGKRAREHVRAHYSDKSYQDSFVTLMSNVRMRAGLYRHELS